MRKMFSIPPSEPASQPPSQQAPAAHPDAHGNRITHYQAENRSLLNRVGELQARITKEIQQPENQIVSLEHEYIILHNLVLDLQRRLGDVIYHQPLDTVEAKQQKEIRQLRSQIENYPKRLIKLEKERTALHQTIRELRDGAKKDTSSTASQEQIDQLQREKADLLLQVSHLQNHTNETQERVELLEKDIIRTESEKDRLVEQVQQLHYENGLQEKQVQQLEKQLDSQKDRHEKQAQQVEKQLQSQEDEIANLTEDNADLAAKLRLAKGRATDARGATENANKSVQHVEDAYVGLEGEYDDLKMSNVDRQEKTSSFDEKLEQMHAIIEQQSSQIYRLEVELEDMTTLEEENRQPREASAQGGTGSEAYENVKNWLLRARDENILLEKDLESLADLWSHSRQPTHMDHYVEINKPKQDVEEHGSDAQSTDPSHPASEMYTPQDLKQWTREIHDGLPSASGESWRNSQSQAGTRPSSRNSNNNGLRSRPNSQAGLPKQLPGPYAGVVSRGTDAPYQRSNRHSLKSRPPSRGLVRNPSSTSISSYAEPNRRAWQEKRNFNAYFPHNVEVPIPKAEPKPPSAARYQQGMDSRDFAIAASQSSRESLDYHRQNGLKTVEEAAASVRPLHRGRKASLSTISERSESVVRSPLRSFSRTRAWIHGDESHVVHLRESGTQTDDEYASPTNRRLDQATQTQYSTSISLDRDTQTEILDVQTDREAPSERTRIVTPDEATRTAFDEVQKLTADKQTATLSPTHFREDTSTQISFDIAPETEDQTASAQPQTLASMHEISNQEKATQTMSSDMPPSKADKGTAMTPREATTQDSAVQATDVLAFSGIEHGVQTDFPEIAELPAPLSKTPEMSHRLPRTPVSEPQGPRSRVAATAQLFDKDDLKPKGPLLKLAVNASNSAPNTPSKRPAVSTTPTELFTDSPHLPFARNAALTKSMEAISKAKRNDGSERQLMEQDASALQSDEEAPASAQLLPAMAYQESQRVAIQELPTLVDASVQTSPTTIGGTENEVSHSDQNEQSYLPSDMSDISLDGRDKSSRSSVFHWETPDDNPYPTPGFYTEPWHSPYTSEYSGLEVVNEDATSAGEHAPIVTNSEDGLISESGRSGVHTPAVIAPPDFARTASPFPEEKEKETWPNDSEEFESDEDEQTEEIYTDLQPREDPKEIRQSLEEAVTEIRGRVSQERPHSAAPGPSEVQEAPTIEVAITTKQAAEPTRHKSSNSPVSPEDATELQIVKYDDPNSLPSPEPPSRAENPGEGERVELDVARPLRSRPGPLTLVLPHTAATMIVESPNIPFPTFDDQLYESPIQYSQPSPPTSRETDEPGVGMWQPMVQPHSLQLRRPHRRPPPLTLLPSRSIVGPATTPLDSPAASGNSQRQDARSQALAALEGRAGQSDCDLDAEELSSVMTRIEQSAHDLDAERLSSEMSRTSSEMSFTHSSAEIAPLRLRNCRLPQFEPQDARVNEIQSSEINEIGATSPTASASPPGQTSHATQPPLRQARHKKASSVPIREAPFVAGLLEWHKSPAAEERNPQARAQTQKHEENRQPTQKQDRGTNTPTFPGGFPSPRVLNTPEFDTSTLPSIPLIVAQAFVRNARIIKCKVDWRKLWWVVLWMAILTYFLFNFWLSIVLRDHIDDWKSANVSSRKYNYIMTARDEYWGNSRQKLGEWILADSLAGSMELHV